MVANGAPRVSTFVVELNGEKYLLANPSQAGEAGGRSWQETERPVQEATREEEFSIPLTSFDEGAGFSYAKIPNVYDYADGWDATTPGKLSTWPLRATGASKTSTDFRGWLIFHDNALYTMRGRFVNKYTIDDTKDATWAIVETHDLGSGIACCGRPAIFKGNLYVPRVTTSSDTLAVFHELTTTATYVTEVQTIVISGSPNAGTYTISFDGKTTAALDFDASESEVQTALRAVAGMEQVTVSTSGTTPNFTHTVTMTGVGASLGAASPPQMTSTPDGAFTGAGGSIAHATTTAGTADTWTAGPATREARCFRVWLNKLVLANANQVRTVSADPMTAGNWSAAYDVGDSSHIINDLAVYDRYLMVGKTDGLWSFDEGLDTQNELPDLQASVDDDNCFVGSVRVNLDGAEAISRRWYEGEVVRVETAHGHHLTGTPNHPILTPKGWVALGDLREQSDVVCGPGCQFGFQAQPDVDHVEATLAEVFDLAAVAGPAERVRSVPQDFHGDGQHGEVDVVPIEGELLNWLKATLAKKREYREFVGSNVGQRTHTPTSAGVQLGFARGGALSTRRSRLSETFLSSHAGGPDFMGLGVVAGRDAVFTQESPDGYLRDSELLAHVLGAEAREIGRDHVVRVVRYPFAGHVYNLRTRNHRYEANGIVAHNCIPMEYSNGYLLVPHKVGLVRWRPGSYEFVGPSQDGELEGEIGRGWGRVYGIAPYGKQVFVMVNDTYHSEGAITSMLPGKGNRFPLVPHIHHLTDTGESFEGAAVLASLTQPATPNSPDTLSDDNAVGTVTWTDASNAGANDQAYATATIGTTHYLKALDFDFTVPTDATIKGILVEIERKVAGS